MSIVHFGRKIRNRKTNLISKEVYMPNEAEIEAFKEKYNFTNEKVKKYLLAVELNYELNMNCYNSLDEKDFNLHLKQQIKRFHLKECTELNEVENISGVYVMVLDKYKQVYVGQAKNIKQRITQHWNKRFPLSRYLLGDICSSVLAIDSFGQLDTTRIYYLHVPEENHKYDITTMEGLVLSAFHPKYTINRTRYDGNSKDDFTAFMKTEELINRLLETEHRPFSLFLEKYPIIRDKYFELNPKLSMKKLGLAAWNNDNTYIPFEDVIDDSLPKNYNPEFIQNDYLTIADLMKMFDCSRNDIMYLYNKKGLPLTKVKNRYVIPSKDFDVWYEKYESKNYTNNSIPEIPSSIAIAVTFAFILLIIGLCAN